MNSTDTGDDRYAIAEDLAQLVRELDDAEGINETAETAVLHAVTAIGATAAGLVINRSGRPVTAVATDTGVEELYELQTTTGDGPMIQAFTTEAPVWIRDTTTETRWPIWHQLATRLGFRTVLHLPLLTGHTFIGVLSFYQTKPDAFTDDDHAVADLITRHTAVALAAARIEAALNQAVDARRLIGQAMGILMERHRIDDQQAFAVLRRYSQNTNTKLRDIAINLIQTRQLP